jgi:hypothetical protein
VCRLLLRPPWTPPPRTPSERRSVRPVACPNAGFAQRLVALDRATFGAASVGPDDPAGLLGNKKGKPEPIRWASRYTHTHVYIYMYQVGFASLYVFICFYIFHTVESHCLRFLLIILGRNGSGNHYFGPKNAEKRIDQTTISG